METVLLPVDDEFYAVPVPWVREVVAAPEVTPLPTSPALFLGLFNLRGEIVPLLDTANLVRGGTMGTVAFAVVLLGTFGTAALGASAFPRWAVLDVPLGRSDHYGTAGVFGVGDALAVLIDPAALLAPDHVEAGRRQHLALPAGRA